MPQCLLPFVRVQAVGEIEPESLLNAAPRAGEVLEVDVGGFLSARFTAEAVESGDEVFERVADQMVGQLLVNRFGKGELLVGGFKVLRKDLKRVVHAAVGAASKHAVNGVAERTGVADDFGFELFFEFQVICLTISTT